MNHPELEELEFFDVQYLPIVKEFAKRLHLVDTINTLVPSQMDLEPGIAVLAMIYDTLSGRTPLYRIKSFLAGQDRELLLNQNIDPEKFSDVNIGRVLDRIYEAGTQKIFSQIIQHAIGAFQIDTEGLHFDTTSISVYGDYEAEEPPFKITHGYSKDKRPDLKQFLVSMLCIDRNIPILGALKDGNASDKSVNNELLSNVAAHMAVHGVKPEAFVYVADSAFVTESNLADAKKNRIKFLSRLPANYDACSLSIREAVSSNSWKEIGSLAETEATPKRPHASYKAFDTTTTLHGETYRAIVVHSSAHDKRRHKRIDRMLKEDRTELEKRCKEAAAINYYCRADAETAAKKLSKSERSRLHRIECSIEEAPKYGPGRPTTKKERIPKEIEYKIQCHILEKVEPIERLREEAGCFVLITNLHETIEEELHWTHKRLLSLYKEQNGIEKNFGFLKDPVIVNSIFLKSHQRIEALGFIVLLSLLIWRLIERSLRQYVKDVGPITGWKDKPTTRPTTFMMTTKFMYVSLARHGTYRFFTRKLNKVQLEYLKALGMDDSIFKEP